jgi:hypothetical protein
MRTFMHLAFISFCSVVHAQSAMNIVPDTMMTCQSGKSLLLVDEVYR